MRYDKLSPGVMTLLNSYRVGGAGAVLGRRQLFGVHPASSGVAEAAHVPRAVVFLSVDADAKLDDLAAEGVHVNQPSGELRTAIVPVDKIARLSDHERIHRIRPTRYLKLAMDTACKRSDVPTFRRKLGLDGKGVVVGIVDSGIDGSHAAFKGRIAYVWDQTVGGGGVREGAYGTETAGGSVAAATDENGHGTHVAGIAAGEDATYEGVAPAATLVVVKSDLNDGHISDAVRYIFRVARGLGMPAVINLSLGGHADAHDGTDALSQIIDQQSGAGRIVCCAAGNEGNDDIHARLALVPSTTVEAAFRIPALNDPGTRSPLSTVTFLNGWYSAGDTLEIAVQDPGGISTPFQRVIRRGNFARTYDLPAGSVTLSTPGPTPKGDLQFLVEVQGPVSAGVPSNAGLWRLRAKAGRAVANGTVHVWVYDGGGHGAVMFRGSSVDDAYKIGSPGASGEAITVGAYTTRVAWTDQGSTPRQIEMMVNAVAGFSSEGPLRNGVHKPDLIAPGAMIVSALSSASSPPDAYRIDNSFRVNAGTSMACPFVSGVIALMLQRNSKLTPQAAKAALSVCCTRPGGIEYDAKWGHGLIECTTL